MFLKTPLSSFQNLFSRLTQKLRYELGSSMLEVTIALVALVGSAGMLGLLPMSN
jgi:Tfp pilus assembly protein PilV